MTDHDLFGLYTPPDQVFRLRKLLGSDAWVSGYDSPGLYGRDTHGFPDFTFKFSRFRSRPSDLSNDSGRVPFLINAPRQLPHSLCGQLFRRASPDIRRHICFKVIAGGRDDVNSCGGCEGAKHIRIPTHALIGEFYDIPYPEGIQFRKLTASSRQRTSKSASPRSPGMRLMVRCSCISVYPSFNSII